MSVQAVVMRPSALPLPKTTSTQSLGSPATNYDNGNNRKCMVPVALDRNRRAGSTPTRSIPTIIRTPSDRFTTRNKLLQAEKNLLLPSSTVSAKKPTNVKRESSNKENNSKAKETSTTRARIINNNNNNRTKDFVKNNAAAVSRKNSTTSRKSSSVNNKPNTTIAASNSSSSSTVSSAKNGHLRPNSGSHRDQQPDLVKVSSPKLSELSRLESVVDAKTQENAQLRARLGHNAKGFEALAITVNQYAKKLDDWNQLDLFKKLEDLNYLVQSKEAEIEQLRLLHAAPKGDEEVDCKNNVVNDDIEDEREAIIAHLQNRLKITAEEHETFIDKLKQDFKSELELQADSLKIEVKSLESEHENLVQDHEARHREIIHEVEEKWKQKLALQLEEQSTEIQNLHGELERQNEKWSESRRNLEEQLHSVQNELRNQEMAVSAKQKGDLLMKSTQNKLSKVLAEVDSLKAVLEMRTEEIHALRLEKAKLEDKLDDFDRMKISLNKVTAQMEDLKAQLNEKQALERKLSEENRQLYNNMEREKNAQRRLTMEKEELEWKMKSFSAADSAGPMSMSMMETGYCGSPFEGMMGSTPLALQTKGSLTASYSEHAPQSLPPFTGRSRKNRPVSAPPGKFDLASLAKSLKDQSGPDSPRLLEVVEKCDSLSWKIEYQEDEIEAGVAGASCAGASPVLKRKTTPPAQMMTRSLERPIKGKDGQNLMTRSLSRSNSTRKKIIPSFEPLSESTESDSLEEQLQKDQEPVKQPASVDIDDLDDDIGDISSSSEIEIDEPLQEVTTPQIEALMFPPAALACSSSASEANMSSPDAEITIRAELCKKPMTSSMPNYDLNKLFKTVQDSGGEGMMEAFTPSSDMMDSESLHLLSTSNDGSSKPGSEMADSTVSMTSWSTTTDDFSSS